MRLVVAPKKGVFLGRAVSLSFFFFSLFPLTTMKSKRLHVRQDSEVAGRVYRAAVRQVA